MNLATY